MLFRGACCQVNGACYQVNLLSGFRFLNLHDSLGLQENDTFFPPTNTDPYVWTTTVDRFWTSNQFYGGQLGADLTWSRGKFYIDVLGKVALGVSVENAGINGWTSFNSSQGQSGILGSGQLRCPRTLAAMARIASP